MSLRAEIRDALDDVIPASPMLEHTVTAFVFADERDRKTLPLRTRRSRLIKSLRAPAAVIAALLVLALIVGLIFGGRLLRDLHGSPAPAINPSVLKRLEARPLVAMPPMPSGKRFMCSGRSRTWGSMRSEIRA